MKRVLLVLIALVLFFSCAGCVQSNLPDNPDSGKNEISVSNSDENASHVQDDDTSDSSSISNTGGEKSETDSSGISGYEDYKTLLIQELANFNDDSFSELKEDIKQDDIQIVSVEKCAVATNKDAKCILFCIDGYFWVIGIVNDHITAFQHVATTPSDEYSIYFADIDGDGLDEIITHFGTTAAKGPSRESGIYKWENNSITPLLVADGSPVENQINWFDAGFELYLSDGYKCTVNNTITGKTEVFNALDVTNLPDFVFDENGNINVTHPTYKQYFEENKPYKNLCITHNFLVFKPVDIDGDGVYEIMAAESFLMDFQLDIGVGLSYIILKYNAQTNSFEVADSAFLPKWVPFDSDEWRTFEENWYNN